MYYMSRQEVCVGIAKKWRVSHAKALSKKSVVSSSWMKIRCVSTRHPRRNFTVDRKNLIDELVDACNIEATVLQNRRLPSEVLGTGLEASICTRTTQTDPWLTPSIGPYQRPRTGACQQSCLYPLWWFPRHYRCLQFPWYLR